MKNLIVKLWGKTLVMKDLMPQQNEKLECFNLNYCFEKSLTF
jgi:hypothetical protein